MEYLLIFCVPKGDAELIYGDFRQRLPADIKDTIYAATKWCIFSAVKQTISREWVLAAVRERSRRLSGRVELLQFHWYDVSITGTTNYSSSLTKSLQVLLERVSGHSGRISTNQQGSP